MNFLKNKDLQDEIRTKVINIVYKTVKTKTHINFIGRQMSLNLRKTVQFIKDNPNLLITKADKGNVTVIVEKNDYYTKVEICLNDENYYMPVTKNPLPNLIKCTERLLVKWEKKNVFNDSIDISFNTKKVCLLLCYGLI